MFNALKIFIVKITNTIIHLITEKVLEINHFKTLKDNLGIYFTKNYLTTYLPKQIKRFVIIYIKLKQIYLQFIFCHNLYKTEANIFTIYFKFF